MADRYVSALASGAGNGTQASPWTLAQIVGATSLDNIYIKNDGVYVVSSTITLNVQSLTIEGYTTTTGDGGTPTIRIAANQIGFSTTGVEWTLKNLIFDGQNTANTKAFSSIQFVYARHGFYNCTFKNLTSNPLTFRCGLIYRCRFEACSASILPADGGWVQLLESDFVGCSGSMVTTLHLGGNAGGTINRCRFLNHVSTVSGIVFSSTVWNFHISNCILHNAAPGGAGIIQTGANNGQRHTLTVIENSIFANFTTALSFTNDAGRNVHAERNAFFNCTTQTNNSFQNISPLTLASSPFQDTANFKLTPAAAKSLFDTGMTFPSSWLSSLGGGSIFDTGTMQLSRES